MPGTPTTGSPNISLLDSHIVADLCGGRFLVDVSPSIFIGDGANNVLGANVQIVSPLGVIVKPYGANYEIAPGLSGGMGVVVPFNIPTQIGNFQYGKYTVNVQLFDAGGASWIVSKPVIICEPDSKNKTRNYGTISAILKADCKGGKMYVIVNNVPAYRGVVSDSQDNAFTLEYPTSSGLPVLNTALGNFSARLFEGVYKISGTVCALYNFGDNVSAQVNYKIKCEKDVRCLIDECCVYAKLEELNLKTKSDCTQSEKDNTVSIILDTLRLLKTIQLAQDCGEDPSDYVEDLEGLLGCKCTCNCAEGTPIGNTDPSGDVSISGCNVVKTTVGLTDVYVIDNFSYVVGVTDNGGAVTASDPTQSGCAITQQLRFDISVVYSQIKGIANSKISEADFWSSIINKTLDGIDPACVIPTDAGAGVWDAADFKGRVQLIINKLCQCCGSCIGGINNATTEESGSDVILSWDESDTMSSVGVFVDGVLFGTVLGGVGNIKLTGLADGQEHTYKIIPICGNGSQGEPIQSGFTHLGCPDIAPPTVAQSLYEDQECPFDLTAVATGATFDRTFEWHNANNNLPGSLVGDPTNVSSGVYYVFAKNTDGCYSIGIKVTILCSADVSCTAPQKLLVSKTFGGNYVQFKSAAYPPPGNAYTVKRRLKTDTDTEANYTTIGTAVWNSSINSWVILDASASDNTLYTYKVESNCGDSPATNPAIEYDFANIVCPSIGFTVLSGADGSTIIPYSFVPSGGGIDKYEVRLFDSTGTVQVAINTYTPAFSNPITGSFTGLSASTLYKLQIKVYIGGYSTTCDFVNRTTSGSRMLSVKAYVNADSLCAQDPQNVYVSINNTDVVTGATIYDDVLLTIKHTGDLFITDGAGNIFNLNSTTGQVGSDTGTNCP